jgi:hypothetical protein
VEFLTISPSTLRPFSQNIEWISVWNKQTYLTTIFHLPNLLLLTCSEFGLHLRLLRRCITRCCNKKIPRLPHGAPDISNTHPSIELELDFSHTGKLSLTQFTCLHFLCHGSVLCCVLHVSWQAVDISLNLGLGLKRENGCAIKVNVSLSWQWILLPKKSDLQN